MEVFVTQFIVRVDGIESDHMVASHTKVDWATVKNRAELLGVEIVGYDEARCDVDDVPTARVVAMLQDLRTAGATADPTDARLNALERGQGMMIRQLESLAKTLQAALSTQHVPVQMPGTVKQVAAHFETEPDIEISYQTSPPSPQAAAAAERGFPLVGQRTSQPRRRRRPAGINEEMASGDMELVGAAPVTTILQASIDNDGKPVVVKGALPRVGDSMKNGTDIKGYG